MADVVSVTSVNPATSELDPDRHMAAAVERVVARQKKARWQRWVLRAIAFIVVFAGWQIVGSSINPIFLSTPTQIVRAFWDMAVSGQLLSALGESAAVLAIGFLAAVVVGVPLGVRRLEFLYSTHCCRPMSMPCSWPPASHSSR